jgi:hypothetical protein
MPCGDCSTDDLCRCGPGEACGYCFEGRCSKTYVCPEHPDGCPEELPGQRHNWKRCTQCRHPEHASACSVCRCAAVTSREEIAQTCRDAGGCPEHPAREERCEGCGHHEGEGCGCPPEPPLTPEEEEQAPEDDACQDCLRGAHGPNAHREEPPPQPDRRPPYAVTYSVQGHLFEVALPGDASVRAVDGALVIQHHLGPVVAICQVLPVINEERG